MNCGFLTLQDLVNYMQNLSDEQFGKMIRLLIEDREPAPDDKVLLLAYGFLKAVIEKAGEVSEKRRQAVQTRWTKVIHKQNNAPRDVQRQPETRRNKTAQNSSKVIHNENDTVNYSVIQCNTPVSTRLQPSLSVSPRARAGSLVLSITSNENTSTSNKNLLLVKKKESIAKERKNSDPAPGPQTSRLPQAKFACCSLFSFSSFPEPWAAYCQASRPELDATKVYHKFLDFYNERSIQRTESEWFDAFRKWVDDEVADESNTAQNVITISRLRKIAFQIANSGSYCYSRYSQGTSSPAELADRLFEYGSRYRSDFDYVIKKAISCRVLKDMSYRPGFEFKEVKVVPNDSEHQHAMSLLETLTDTTRIN